MVRLAVVAVVLAMASTALAGDTVTMTRAEFEAAVEKEVARRLPAAVEKELRRREGVLRSNSAMSILMTMRSQLELYALQHRDKKPTLAQIADWKALTSQTDADGKVVETGGFGPYVLKAPANPFNGKTKIAAEADAETGYVYDEKTGAVRVVVPAGVAHGLEAGDMVEVGK